ncbi:MAG: precorrin-6y C5,15-methyltransferase (decarboxylating) subunit CbiE [Clostridia bacterium]|nr:MAG: precorrin-6y C5,15-methyltransferase (decarboxylating) subunit CbiE [Clostridia bacterium]
MPARVLVIGIGPGSREYLLPAAAAAAARATVLVGSRRALELFPESVAEKREISLPLEDTIAYIRARARTQRVAVLLSGDPCFHSLLPRLRQEFAPEEMEVHPGLSPWQLAFARLKEDTSQARVISLHGHDWDELEAVLDLPRVAVLTDRHHSPTAIARYLLDRGVRKVMYVCENLGYPEERITRIDAGQGIAENFSALNLVVLLDA